MARKRRGAAVWVAIEDMTPALPLSNKP